MSGGALLERSTSAGFPDWDNSGAHGIGYHGEWPAGRPDPGDYGS